GISVGFFFQAEDGIRDFHVTGVQTCALPILSASTRRRLPDMPRWAISVPHSAPISRYLARRSTRSMRCPDRRTSRSSGIGQRSRRSRTTTRRTRWPMRNGSMPRRVVSTSGNSGIDNSVYNARSADAVGMLLRSELGVFPDRSVLADAHFQHDFLEVVELVLGQADIIEHQRTQAVPFMIVVLLTEHLVTG